MPVKILIKIEFQSEIILQLSSYGSNVICRGWGGEGTGGKQSWGLKIINFHTIKYSSCQSNCVLWRGKLRLRFGDIYFEHPDHSRKQQVSINLSLFSCVWWQTYVSIKGDASSSSKMKIEIYSTANQLLWYSGILKSLEWETQSCTSVMISFIEHY